MPIRAVLQRPGTLLLLVLVANTYAYFVSHGGDSAVGLLTYLLQAFLLYRIWRGANLVPALLLLAIAAYEAYCVKQVFDAGAAAGHRGWVTAHVLAVAVTVTVLISAPVRRRMGPLRGIRKTERA
ncbi:hypothetical protein [Cryptosporangium sp. NPDC048952]|uniref:hypothetical protein n=1 Tax=Cryptosporangium sp. NPDC048952 TaxID=3363961 RepID=UPI003719FF14